MPSQSYERTPLLTRSAPSSPSATPARRRSSIVSPCPPSARFMTPTPALAQVPRRSSLSYPRRFSENGHHRAHSMSSTASTTPLVSRGFALPRGASGGYYGACTSSASSATVTPPGETPPLSSTATTPGRVTFAPAAGAALPKVPRAVAPVPLCESISRARLVLICAGIWSSNFAFAFQTTSIPTLAPLISSSFQHAELASFLGSAYTLGNTAGIPVYGVLIDTLGRRFAMLTACAFFGLGTIACALAPGMYPLIAGRALAGLGGGGLLTVSAVICTDLVHLRDRGFYQGIMMTIFGIGSAIGGPLSGWLADTYAWRLSFWIQIPIIVLCATIVTIFLPEPPTPPTHTSVWTGLRTLDWAGSALLLSSVSGGILALSLHTAYWRPWSDPLVWGLLLASAAGCAAFIAVEARAPRPIVPLSMFKSRQLVAIWLSGFFLTVSSSAFQYQIPLYFAVMIDSGAARAGLVGSICSGIGLSTGSLFAGHYIRRGGKYTWLGIVALLPAIAASVTAARWTAAWPEWSYYATVLPTTIGYAIFLCVTLIAVISSVPPAQMPKATALLYTVRSLGGTLGVSLGGSIQVGALVSHLKRQLRHLPAPQRREIIDAVVHSKSAIKALEPALQRRAMKAYAGSLSVVWLCTAVVACATLLCSLFIRGGAVGEKKVKVVCPRVGGRLGQRRASAEGENQRLLNGSEA